MELLLISQKDLYLCFSLYQRCHLIYDRPHHLAQRRITYLLRRAVGDLFLGPYPVNFRLYNEHARAVP